MDFTYSEENVSAISQCKTHRHWLWSPRLYYVVAKMFWLVVRWLLTIQLLFCKPSWQHLAGTAFVTLAHYHLKCVGSYLLHSQKPEQCINLTKTFFSKRVSNA